MGLSCGQRLRSCKKAQKRKGGVEEKLGEGQEACDRRVERKYRADEGRGKARGCREVNLQKQFGVKMPHRKCIKLGMLV